MKNIEESKLYIYERDQWSCQVCENPIQGELNIAHRIRQGKNSERVIKNYLTRNSISGIKVKDVLQHPLNMCVACAGKCNSSVDISFQPVNVDVLIYQIIETIKNGK